MKAEFSAIYFPRPAVAPKTSMISVEDISATSDDTFEDIVIVERLTTVPRNSSVILLMHGHAGFTTNMHSWARLASHFDSLSIYIACCTQAARISNRLVEWSGDLVCGEWIQPISISPHIGWTILSLDSLVQAWEEDTPDPSIYGWEDGGRALRSSNCVGTIW